jgi:hypothetical protein
MNIDLLETRRLLDQLGLVATSRHVRMPDLFSNWRTLLRQCQLLGNRHIICAEVPGAQPVGLGEGRLDLVRVLAAADQAGVAHYFVDDRRRESPWEHAKANLAYLSRLEF